MKAVILGGVDAAVGALEKTIGYTSNFGKFFKPRFAWMKLRKNMVYNGCISSYDNNNGRNIALLKSRSNI